MIRRLLSKLVEHLLASTCRAPDCNRDTAFACTTDVDHSDRYCFKHEHLDPRRRGPAS